MLVRYRGIDLEVERVVQWSDRNIYSEDNTERIMRHVALAVQCVINPSATFLADQVGVATTAAGVAAELKRRLLVPRGELVIRVGNSEVLRSPQDQRKPGTPGLAYPDGVARHYCDARGGPNPLHVDVTSIHGTKSMLATFAVETWLADNRIGDGGEPAEQSALIAHRWEQSNDLDEHYYSTRTITGRAVFRADWLYTLDDQSGYLRQADLKPQDYLAYLNHPLPFNYRRERVRTRVSSDGLTLDYTIVDVEQQCTIEATRPISRISGSWSSGISHANIHVMPSTFTNIDIAVEGRRGATYNDIVAAALKAATTYDRGARLSRRLYWANQLTVDIGRKRARLHMGYSITGVVQHIVGNGLNILGFGNEAAGLVAGAPHFPEDLNGNLGNSLRVPTLGQQPMFGMVGALLNDVPGGGQQRLNTQQVGDQFVPAQPPESTRASIGQTTEVDNAALARGVGQRRIE